jgi:NADH-ubiquinone oxidoreductase chain 6
MINNLYIINEVFTNGYKDLFLDFFSLSAILFGILVIISKNPIVSVLFLIALFLSISAYLILLGMNFIGLSYLLVYVGAVSILFLFILMLINVRISELLSDTGNSIPLAIILGICFNFVVYQILPYSVTSFNSYTTSLNNISNDNYSDYLNKVFNYSNDVNEIAFVTSKI